MPLLNARHPRPSSQTPAAPESAAGVVRSGDSAPGGLTSLDPLETNVALRPGWAARDLHDPIAATRSQRALHARHWKQRERLIRVLLSAPVEELQKRALRLDGCCQRPQLFEGPDGVVSLRLRCCRDRLCPRCQRSRGLELAQRIRALIASLNAPRFVTLTLKHRPESLRENHDRLQKAFRSLRKEPVWSGRVTGGICVTEITRNERTGMWHTHLHLVVDGEFLPQKQLSEAWNRCTGDSVIVDVRAVHDRSRVASYIAEYVAKPQDLHTWQATSVLEFAAHMHGRRMVATFGKCHRVNVDPAETKAIPRSEKYIGDVVSLMDRADRGCRNARKAREILCRMGPLWQMAIGIPPDQCVAISDEITADEWKMVKLSLVQDDYEKPEIPAISRHSMQLEFPQQSPPRDWHDSPRREQHPPPRV